MTAKITLTWNNGSSEHVDQIVYKSTEAFTSSNLPPILARVGRDAREYIDTDIVTGNVYFYAVASENAADEVLLSSVISVTAGGSGGDPHWAKVVALVHFDTDYSDSTGTVWTPAPNTIISATAKFGSGAMYSDGYAGISANGEQFNFGTDDYTIEGYWKADAINRSFFAWDGGKRVLYGSNLGYAYWNGSINAIAGISVNTTDFVHIAFTRASGVARLFIDGVLVGTYIHDSLATTSNSVKTGNFGSQNLSGGYTDELRITKGVARYTENFTPPTEPFPNF